MLELCQICIAFQLVSVRQNSACDKIVEVIMIVKDGLLHRCNPDLHDLLKLSDTSLYPTNGYFEYLFSRIPRQVVVQLQTVSLHIDITRYNNLREFAIMSAVEDLINSIDRLAELHFETFIEISFRPTPAIQPGGYPHRNLMMSEMVLCLRNTLEYHRKTDFIINGAEGYAGITIEEGKTKYSFRFFYKNPLFLE
ncbi:unnamed protein product [Onchocerca ochengi]|uniref:Guanylate cyclase domain-containing protein n=1 Tax=Onchocerca ochengi TaxID=42157 RepID=A0A182EIK8_ONCOC|nr:unnamed protein product [Onchocerca ochengi]